LQLGKPLYVVLCVAVPPLWGLVSYWLFELLARKWPRKVPASAPEPPDAGDAEDDCGCQN
jgi:hypothetical protein